MFLPHFSQPNPSLNYRNPTPEENHYLTVTWLPVTKDNLYYLNLGQELSIETNPDKEKMEFWDDLYSKYYRIWEHPKTNIVETTFKSSEPRIVETFTESVSVFSSSHVTEESHTFVSESSEIITENNEVISESHEVITGNNFEPENHEVVTENNVTITETTEPKAESPEPIPENHEVVTEPPEVIPERHEVDNVKISEVIPEPAKIEELAPVKALNGERKVSPQARPSNEIKMVSRSNGAPKDVIRANDPPEDDLPKNIGVNKFVNFFESLGAKK